MSKVILNVFAALMLAASISMPAAAAQPGLPFLAPLTEKTNVWCKRYCHSYGYCGYGYNKHRCCKKWVCH